MSRKSKLIQDVYNPPALKRVYTYMPATPPRSASRRTAVTPAPSSAPKKNFRKLSLIGLTVLICGLVLVKLDLSGSEAPQANRSVKAAAVDKTPVYKKIDTAAVEQRVNTIIAKYPHLQISVSFNDLKTQTALHYGVEEPYLAASTSKLLTAILFLHQVEEGKYSLTEQVGGLSMEAQLRLLIEESDNTAWVNFDKVLGSGALEQYASQVGLKNYDYSRNTTTSSDIALLLEKLYNQKLLNKKNTQLLLSFMQNASESRYIPAAVSKKAKVYHKAGHLEDRVHDAAIIDSNGRPFVLVIFTKANSGQYDFSLGTQIMHDITKVFLSAYH